ncbi:MAG: serine hydrolase [Lentisphaerae bacterium]|jgi:CubicO group peptidase (beta-lactamase class C family)|nr:serine hydrolase [Lentisphaerota bacterium]MBT4819370.1 serine hydrolase [Lentisphaerota bacterium]MBT5606945.1 serine hydrolase [Lentisphaerota bacterium]MBT7055098.1 serine hydrolase [Lentisphaerota bacterium]MBT7842212.1 serine hydrolase [Lentisphaerota bacterium]
MEAQSKMLSSLLEAAVSEQAWPGAVLAVGRRDCDLCLHAVGFHTYERAHVMRNDDVFDLASLTKVIATTTAVQRLVDEGSLGLDELVGDRVSAFVERGLPDLSRRRSVTISHLLTHTSGLPAWLPIYTWGGDSRSRLLRLCETPLLEEPGARVVYSDLGFILLGMVVEAVSGERLDAFFGANVALPLELSSATCYRPDPVLLPRMVPTEQVGDTGERFVHGRVHDENAAALGGVAGHAGLFSCAADLATVARMLLHHGATAQGRFLSRDVVDRFTRAQRFPDGGCKCLGWDSPSGISSGGIHLSDVSYGHTGFTGTSLWIDPVADLFVILLTNAVHPKRECKTPLYFDWRQRVHSAAYDLIGGRPPNPRLRLRERWVGSS